MIEPTVVQQPPRPDLQVLQIGNGYVLSAALHVAAKLGIADRLAGGPQPVSALAAATRVNEDALYRLLRALASVGIFTEVGSRTFALTPAAETIRSDRPGSVKDLVQFITDPFHFRVYADMFYSIETGLPAGEKVVGMPVFKYFEQDKEESDSFNQAMTSFSGAVVSGVLNAYDFSAVEVLVDVAGGHGELLTSVLRQYPKMRGILVDLDHVIAGARPRIAEMGLADRCKAESGDFFKSVPAGGDMYMMKSIIHDWDDARAETILKNIRKALEGRKNGRVILVEAIVQPANQPDFAKVMDLEMLMLPGGRERDANEFRALFARCGFDLTTITPTESPMCVIEARPV